LGNFESKDLNKKKTGGFEKYQGIGSGFKAKEEKEWQDESAEKKYFGYDKDEIVGGLNKGLEKGKEVAKQAGKFIEDKFAEVWKWYQERKK